MFIRLLILFTFLFVRLDAFFISDEDGKPSLPLLAILEAFDVEHDGTWESIAEATQRNWLRNIEEERWDISIREDFKSLLTYALFTGIGMTQTFWSPQRYYDYVVILGDTLQVARERFQFLKEEWEKGLRFRMLVVLTGDRLLIPAFEGTDQMIYDNESPYPFRTDWIFSGKIPTNEKEMMELVFDQMDLPPELREIPLCMVDTPKPEGLSRPQTLHTFLHWLTHYFPLPGSCLLISSQPFLWRQDLIGRKLLPYPFVIDSAGPGFSLAYYREEIRGAAILLDELARWIYEQIHD